MPEKKKTTNKDMETTAPTIVEVYGEEGNVKTENEKLKIDGQNETSTDGDDERVEIVEDEREDEAPKEEERMTLETLKTEAVGAESVVGSREPILRSDGLRNGAAGVGGGQNAMKGEKRNDNVEAQSRDNKSLRQARDADAFEEEIGHQKKAARSIFGVGIVIFLVIFGLTGWAFYLKTVWLSKETVTSVLVSQPTESVTSMPVASASAQLTREDITLQILNGSGVVGLAGKTAKTFEDLGYKTPDTGNTAAVTATELYVKQDLEEQLTVLMGDVKDTLSVASVTGYLKSSDTMTARIVLGK